MSRYLDRCISISRQRKNREWRGGSEPARSNDLIEPIDVLYSDCFHFVIYRDTDPAWGDPDIICNKYVYYCSGITYPPVH